MTVQSGMKSTTKLAVSVVPDTVCVNVPPPSLPVIKTSYWSIGLSPGTAALQAVSSVAVAAPCPAHRAVTPVGAEGKIDAAVVVMAIGVDAMLDPPMVVFTTVISYVVWGWSDPMRPFVADPTTLAVRIGAEEETGVAVKVDDVIAIGLASFGVQDTWN